MQAEKGIAIMAKNLPEVINWRRRDDNITLSGQPSESQLGEIKALGVTHIVNLGPHTNDGALDDEAKSVADLGMAYVYIPVDFENPTEADFDTFCKTLDELQGKTIHVHCIYNARVSAFFYRYALEGRGGSKEEAFELMDGIWKPGGVWARFISNEADQDLPNRFLGYEY